MTATIELNSSRKKLCSVLNDGNESQYFNHLKNWFRKRITKEKFDNEARKLLAKEHTHLHNEFLLAILNKCQTLANFSPSSSSNISLGSPSISAVPNVVIKTEPGITNIKAELVMATPTDRTKKPMKRKCQPLSYDQGFLPIQELIKPEILELHPDEKSLRYCYQDPTLPDISLIHGRMLITAWEESLDGVEDPAVSIILDAVENQLRTLVMALVMKRKGFKMRNKSFPYAFGINAPNPWLKNSKVRLGSSSYQPEVTEFDASVVSESFDYPLIASRRLSVEEEERRSVIEMACSSNETDSQRIRRPISLSDLLRLMQERKSLIPCHSVYAKNLERVISRIQHAGRDD